MAADGRYVEKQTKTVKFLLKVAPQIANVKNSKNNSVLNIASWHGYTDIVKLSLGVAPQVIVTDPKKYQDALYMAHNNGYEETVKVLLSPIMLINGNKITGIDFNKFINFNRLNIAKIKRKIYIF